MDKAASHLVKTTATYDPTLFAEDLRAKPSTRSHKGDRVQRRHQANSNHRQTKAVTNFWAQLPLQRETCLLVRNVEKY